jgi:hypothetical protein
LHSNDKLRFLENELSDNISKHLPGWTDSRRERQICEGAVNVTYFISRRAHIFASHGPADKNYTLRRDRAGGLEINKYRVVLVPGFWMKRKLLSHPDVQLKDEQIVIAGWPRLDTLLAASKSKRRAYSAKKNVLWAPTHNNHQDEFQGSSYPDFASHTDILSKHFDYHVSLHPSTRGGGRPTFEMLLDADVVISDRGTLVYEALALGKPVIFPDWLLRDWALAESSQLSAEAEMFKKRIGLHAANIDQLIEMAEAVTSLDAKTKQFVADYIEPTTYGRSYELVAGVVKGIWASGDLRVRERPRSIR